jgi:hypothetical protein
MTNKPPPQKILQGILHMYNESKQNHEKAARKVKSNTDSATHNQTLSQKTTV